jgi:hypothetical protein
MPDDAMVFRFPATILEVRATEPDLMDLVKKNQVYDQAILDEHDPFFWKARVSSTVLDTYFTNMMVSSLRNYAREAKEGVAFLDSHKSDSQTRTLGRSVNGTYVPKDANDYAETLADFFTLKGLAPEIDQFIARTRAGLSKDVSVGFFGGKFICSVCKRDMLTDWDCWHFPGFTYAKDGGRAQKDQEQVICTAGVDDAHLAEVSTVYHGATPGAGIIKAERAAQAGKLPPRMARAIEERYHVRLLGTTQLYLPAVPESEERMSTKNSLGEGTKVADLIEVPINVDTTQLEELLQREITRIEGTYLNTLTGVLEVLASRGVAVDAPPETIVATVRDLAKEVDRLTPLAKDGEAYRADLIRDTLAEGVRAYGNTFAAPLYESTFRGADIAFVRQMHDDWKRMADLQIPTGAHVRGEENGTGSEPPAINPARHRA